MYMLLLVSYCLIVGFKLIIDHEFSHYKSTMGNIYCTNQDHYVNVTFERNKSC